MAKVITFARHGGPEVFEITDDGWAVADPGEVPAELEGAVHEAIDNCPECAISEL